MARPSQAVGGDESRKDEAEPEDPGLGERLKESRRSDWAKLRRKARELFEEWEITNLVLESQERGETSVFLPLWGRIGAYIPDQGELGYHDYPGVAQPTEIGSSLAPGEGHYGNPGRKFSGELTWKDVFHGVVDELLSEGVPHSYLEGPYLICPQCNTWVLADSLAVDTVLCHRVDEDGFLICDTYLDIRHCKGWTELALIIDF